VLSISNLSETDFTRCKRLDGVKYSMGERYEQKSEGMQGLEDVYTAVKDIPRGDWRKAQI
jgi:hypothetical protein